jgi:hypothetical protein
VFLSLKDKSQIGAGLSKNSIILRLKEQLQLGVGKAFNYSSKADGYLVQKPLMILS